MQKDKTAGETINWHEERVRNYARQDSNLQPRDSVPRRFPGGLDFPITLELRFSSSPVGWRPSSLYTFPMDHQSNRRVTHVVTGGKVLG